MLYHTLLCTCCLCCRHLFVCNFWWLCWRAEHIFCSLGRVAESRTVLFPNQSQMQMTRPVKTGLGLQHAPGHNPKWCWRSFQLFSDVEGHFGSYVTLKVISAPRWRWRSFQFLLGDTEGHFSSSVMLKVISSPQWCWRSFRLLGDAEGHFSCWNLSVGASVVGTHSWLRAWTQASNLYQNCITKPYHCAEFHHDGLKAR